GRAWRRGPFFGPLRGRRPRGGRGSAGADRALLRRAERTPLAGRLFRSGSAGADRPGPSAPSGAVAGQPMNQAVGTVFHYVALHCVAWKRIGCSGRHASGGGPHSQGGGGWSPGTGRWVAGVWGVAGVSPRPVGHPEGYPEPGGAARPGRFAVAQARAWHPRRNPGTGGACPTDRGEPPPPGRESRRTPPGEAAAGGAETAVDLRKCVIQITRPDPCFRWTPTPE